MIFTKQFDFDYLEVLFSEFSANRTKCHSEFSANVTKCHSEFSANTI